MRIAILGHGRCGKDTAAEILNERYPSLRYWGSTSEVILPYAANVLGVPEAEAWATRHENRDLWKRLGNILRKDDPAALARHCLARGDILVGVRARSEWDAVVAERMVDLTLWIDRDVPHDDTLELTADDADIIVPNWDSVHALRRRVYRLCKSLGILKITEGAARA